jgi:hypothetical protein
VTYFDKLQQDAQNVALDRKMYYLSVLLCFLKEFVKAFIKAFKED